MVLSLAVRSRSAGRAPDRAAWTPTCITPTITPGPTPALGPSAPIPATCTRKPASWGRAAWPGKRGTGPSTPSARGSWRQTPPRPARNWPHPSGFAASRNVRTTGPAAPVCIHPALIQRASATRGDDRPRCAIAPRRLRHGPRSSMPYRELHAAPTHHHPRPAADARCMLRHRNHRSIAGARPAGANPQRRRHVLTGCCGSSPPPDFRLNFQRDPGQHAALQNLHNGNYA